VDFAHLYGGIGIVGECLRWEAAFASVGTEGYEEESKFGPGIASSEVNGRLGWRIKDVEMQNRHSLSLNYEAAASEHMDDSTT
jgi:hypothetical protein